MAIISNLPEGANVLDLDAARVARAEARAKDGKGWPFLKLSAGYVAVHAEIPVAAAFLFGEQKIREGLQLVLVDPEDIDLLWEDLTAEDMNEIANFITGKSLGESQA